MSRGGTTRGSIPRRYMRCNTTVLHLAAWAREAGLKYRTLTGRVRRWGAGCRAVLQPLNLRRSAAVRAANKARALRRLVQVRGTWVRRGKVARTRLAR